MKSTHVKRVARHWEEHRNGSDGRKQERRLAKELGAKPTPASGALPDAKSDAVSPEYRYEMKTTSAKKVPVNSDVLSKIWREARATGKIPVVVVHLEAIKEPVPQDWVLIELDTFKELSGQEPE